MVESATKEQSAAPPAIDHPNIYWRFFRFLVRMTLPVWIRYASRGSGRIPLGGGGLLVINHQSYLDVPLVGMPLYRGVAFITRDNLLRAPILGWVLRRTYVIGINRDSASSATIREACAAIESGRLVGLFPEGTRTADGSIGPLKPGFTSLLRRTAAPVYPIGIAGGMDALPRGAFFIRPARCRVVFGEPIPAETIARLSARGQEATLTETIRAAMEACRREAQEWLDRGD